MDENKMEKGAEGLVAFIMGMLIMIPYIIVGLVESGCF